VRAACSHPYPQVRRLDTAIPKRTVRWKNRSSQQIAPPVPPHPSPMNLGLPESCRRFPLSPSEGERAGVRGPPWGSGAQSAAVCRGVLSPRRGSHAVRRLSFPNVLALPTRGRRCSLSFGERAGVRGNESAKPPMAAVSQLLALGLRIGRRCQEWRAVPMSGGRISGKDERGRALC
jgi:hypothetical protein